MASAQLTADYLSEYITCYRRQYDRLVKDAPEDLRYPNWRTSPYLDSATMKCYVAIDGVVIADFDNYWNMGEKINGTQAVASFIVPSSRARFELPDPIARSLVESGTTTVQVEVYRMTFTDLWRILVLDHDQLVPITADDALSSSRPFLDAHNLSKHFG